MLLIKLNLNNIYKEISKFSKEFSTIIIGLILIIITNIYSKEIDYYYDNLKFTTNHILNDRFDLHLNESKREVINNIFLKTSAEIWDDNIKNPDFQILLWKEIRNSEVFTGTKIIQSIILWFLYWFAYMATIVKVRDKYMPIDTKSFLTFSLTSGWMVLVNWFIPGSIVYAESFILAWYAVFLHSKNKIEWNKYLN